LPFLPSVGDIKDFASIGGSGAYLHRRLPSMIFFCRTVREIAGSGINVVRGKLDYGYWKTKRQL
jgi:hypothetical protein